MEHEDYRRASHATWEAMARGWERWRAQLEEDATPIRRWMVDALAAKRGDTVLELSAGAGDTGFEVAPRLGSEGRLISSDFSPEMVEVGRRRADELSLANVEHQVLDAEDIDLPDDSVDGVICRWGYMLMADPAAALSETRRVLRPGGRLVLSVWGRPEDNPWGAVVARFLVERGHMAAPAADAPGAFSMGSEERTRALLADAGFRNVEREEIPVRFAFRDLDDYLSWAVNAAGAVAVVLRGLPEEERPQLEAELERAFAPFAADDGYEIPACSLNAVAG